MSSLHPQVLCSSLTRHARPAGTELQKCSQGPTYDELACRPERSPQHQLPVSLCGAVPDDHFSTQSPVQDRGLQAALLCGRLVCIACMAVASWLQLLCPMETCSWPQSRLRGCSAHRLHLGRPDCFSTCIGRTVQPALPLPASDLHHSRPLLQGWSPQDPS